MKMMRIDAALGNPQAFYGAKNRVPTQEQPNRRRWKLQAGNLVCSLRQENLDKHFFILRPCHLVAVPVTKLVYDAGAFSQHGLLPRSCPSENIVVPVSDKLPVSLLYDPSPHDEINFRVFWRRIGK